MPKKSKLYRARAEKVEHMKQYALSEAFQLLKSMPPSKFDETVELALKLGVDPKQSDQTVRGAVSLPKGTGKSVRVAVIAADAAADAAKAAGADFVGMEDLVAKISGGWLEFDVLIATTAAMPKVRPLGKVLGPRGLMPNPKTGTVTDDTATAVRESKAGRVEFRADKGACLHAAVGKVSFAQADLEENCLAVIRAILRCKPTGIKGHFILSGTLSSTMSPGIKLNANEIMRVT